MTKCGKAALMVAFLIAPAVAGAAGPEQPRAEQHSQTLRSFVLRNRADKPITEAHAYTTQQKDIVLTDKGPIQPLRSQEFMIQQSECVDRVSAKLQDGRTLTLDNMQDCRNPTIFVDNSGISIDTAATGLTLQGTPRGSEKQQPQAPPK